MQDQSLVRDQRRGGILPTKELEDERYEAWDAMQKKVQTGPRYLSIKLPSYDVMNIVVSFVKGFLVIDLKKYINDALVRRGHPSFPLERMRLVHENMELFDEKELKTCNLNWQQTVDVVIRMLPTN